MTTFKVPRSFCFTINNFTDEEYDAIHDPENYEKFFSYLVTAVEVGEEGTPHIQAYAECKTQMRKSAIDNYGFARAHIKRRYGTPEEAAGYCKKGIDEKQKTWAEFFPRSVADPETWERPFEYGTISSQGKRTDITEVVESIKEGSTIREVARDFPEQFVKYHRGLTALRTQLIEPRQLDAPPEVIVLHGPTGVGKTRDAYLKYWPDEPHYVWRPSNGNWWDGYDGQKKVIIDEYRGQMSWPDILGLLDRNEYRAPIKGGFVQIVADKFVITSPTHPNKWHGDRDEDDTSSQLMRRLTEIIRLPEVGS